MPRWLSRLAKPISDSRRTLANRTPFGDYFIAALSLIVGGVMVVWGTVSASVTCSLLIAALGLWVYLPRPGDSVELQSEHATAMQIASSAKTSPRYANTRSRAVSMASKVESRCGGASPPIS